MSDPTCDPKTHPSRCSCCQWRLETELPEARARIVALEAELLAYKKAKAENDERFMIERDEARRELEALRRGPDDEAVRRAMDTHSPRPGGMIPVCKSGCKSQEDAWILSASCRKAWARVKELDAALLKMGNGHDWHGHLEATEAALEKAEARVKNMETALHLSDEAYKQCKGELEAAERELAEAKDMLTFYQNERDHAKDQLAEAHGRIKQMEDTVRVADYQYVECEKRHARWSESYKTEIAALKAEVERRGDLSARVKALEERHEKARALIERAYRYPLSGPNSACGVGCDMGWAGPGLRGEHDPDCEIANLYSLFFVGAGER